jgi:hypothetical protein
MTRRSRATSREPHGPKSFPVHLGFLGALRVADARGATQVWFTDGRFAHGRPTHTTELKLQPASTPARSFS